MDKLGHYEIIEKIGAGGMGEVYRARDTRLGRDVALKLLPPAFAADADRLSRFEREARVLAALNHPGIAAIYGLERADGKSVLVLELVPGEDLSQRIAQGPLPLDEALPIAQAIAEALEYAHEQGVVHRDLKPANIKLTPDGRVKVLDFGLAKALESDDGKDPRLSQSPTVLASSPTVAGVILGTAAYMSPEQARGKSVDKRSDVFAFGSVLYEMLTGRQAFNGETVSDTLASVLKTQPEVTVLPGDTPRAIRELLRRCLEKDVKLRLRDIGEARIVLERARVAGPEEESATVTTAPPVDGAARFRANLVWGVATLVIAAGAFFASRLVTPVAHDAPLRKFTIDLTENTTGTDLQRIALSPDGSKIAYVHDDALWVRDLSRLDALEIPGSKGVEIPFWSPDSKQLGYRINNTFFRVNATGGASTVITTTSLAFISGAGARWTDDDRIIFTIGSRGIFEVSALGGDPVEVVPRQEREVDLHEPDVLPGGRGYLFVEHRQDAGPSYLAVYADGKRKTLLSLEGQRIWTPRYADTGHILFRRTPVNEGLWALPFSLSKLEVTGEPFLVALDGSEPCPGPDGMLVYRLGSEVAQSQLAWIKADGTFDAAISDVFSGTGTPSISPDGGRVAGVVSEGGAAGDLWVFDLARGTRQRLTFEPSWEILPCWSPDGKTVYYTSTADRSIRARAADGTGAEAMITYGYRPGLTQDGTWMVFDRDNDVCAVAMPADTTAEVKRIVATPAAETNPALSPSGSLVAYMSDESGRDEVYLTRFPSGDGKWQVSVNGGINPTWDPAGGALYFTSETEMMRVEVDETPDLRLGNPRALFLLDDAHVPSGRLAFFAVDRGGKRLAMAYHPAASGQKPMLRIAVVENWLGEFQKKN